VALSVREVELGWCDEAALVEVSGAIDPHGNEPLDRAIGGLRARGKKTIALDLSAVRYVNSSGFATLVKHASALEDQGGGLSLLGVPPKVQIVLEMLGLEPQFAVVCKHRPGAFART
jgi:anti-sigma B factor antagonist